MEEILTLDDREFLVVKTINHKNTNYYYVIATDGTNDIAFLKESIENNEKFVASITNEEELKEITDMFNKAI